MHSLPCSWKRRDAPKGQRDSVERAYPVFLNMRCSVATPSPRERTCRTSTPRSSRTSQSAQAATRISGRRHEAMIDRAELVRGWLEHAADCKCPFLDDCPLFDEPTELPPRQTF